MVDKKVSWRKAWGTIATLVGFVAAVIAIILGGPEVSKMLAQAFNLELSDNAIWVICIAAVQAVVLALIFAPWHRIVGSESTVPKSQAQMRLAIFLGVLDDLIEKGEGYSPGGTSAYGDVKWDAPGWVRRVKSHLKSCSKAMVDDFADSLERGFDITEDRKAFIACVDHLKNVRAGLSEEDFADPEPTASSDTDPT